MTSTEELDRFAIGHGIDTHYLAGRFITAVREQAGIDYEQLLGVEAARAGVDSVLADRARVGPHFHLCSAATTDLFTVCTGDGRPVWRERFTADELALGAVSTVAAMKAIGLAGRCLGEWGARAGTLRLHLACNHGIDWARLHRHAGGLSLVVHIATVPVDNPAAQQCLHREPVSPRYLDLSDLFDPGALP
ncbi:hypothetical protein [Nocardia thailandica]|uniref:hypothetical protein n=1 Tax=Nocardia thailandica TaxID=257275 RepID=UPI0012FCA2B3|nr:hypothetical protein [Nocardia thailandica]